MERNKKSFFTLLERNKTIKFKEKTHTMLDVIMSLTPEDLNDDYMCLYFPKRKKIIFIKNMLEIPAFRCYNIDDVYEQHGLENVRFTHDIEEGYLKVIVQITRADFENAEIKTFTKDPSEYILKSELEEYYNEECYLLSNFDYDYVFKRSRDEENDF